MPDCPLPPFASFRRLLCRSALGGALTLATGGQATAQDFDVETDTSIVERVSGTGRGVYVPLDETRILPRLRGLWAQTAEQCTTAASAVVNEAARMEGVQIVGARTIFQNGKTWQARAIFVAADSDVQTARFADYRDDRENLLVFREGMEGAERRMLMYLTPAGRLAQEEVGERRQVLVACALDAAAIEDYETRQAAADGTAVLTYQATIAAADTVNSAGVALADVAGILQQDRFNVDMRDIRHGFDTPDTVFTDKAKRLALGQAEVDISPTLRTKILTGGVSVHVEVRETGTGGRYRVRVTPAPIFEMPKAFQGTWAGSHEKCSDGGLLSVMTMDATGLHQAEGDMAVRSVVVDPDDPRRITLESENSGGGETWLARHDVTLSPDGSVMEFRPLGEDAGPPWTLLRCG